MGPGSFWERTDGRQALILSGAAILLGLLGAFAALVLYRLIMLFTNLSFYRRVSTAVVYPPDHLTVPMILLPALGGLIVGVMARYGTDRIRGHGIPEAMEAIITRKSRVEPRVAVLKPVSAAIAVGTGGPFGAEGPIIQTGGALASLIGQLLHLTADERKVFLACGAAAGMVGIFNTPMAAVALAVELLLFEFRARSLVPVVVASAVAAVARSFLLGTQRMFPTPPLANGTPVALLYILPLGVLIGIAAVIVSKGLFLVEELFEETLRIPMVLAPALGGLLLGIIGYVEPRVLGMGYPTISALIAGQFTPARALALAAAKTVALWAALGSGTSGGLLAPMLLIGAGIGSAYGQVVAALVPGAGLQPGVCAIVAMSALFGAAARVPFTSFLFAYELTGDAEAIVPLMLGCMVSDIVARLLSEHSVMTERLAQRGLVVPLRYEADILTYLTVGALMRSDFRVVDADTPVRLLLAELRAAEQPGAEPGAYADLRRLHHWWIVQDSDGRFVGLITRRQLVSAQLDEALLNGPARQLATTSVVVAYPDETMHDALVRMLQNDRPWLPVVERTRPWRVVGYVTREDALAARRRRLEDEVIREGILRLGSFRLGARLAREIERPAS
ncbi:MAG: chloride channel protein [Chloroflexi bacterium]|nr:chloride channel protein [Chloroflexota bacterium]